MKNRWMGCLLALTFGIVPACLTAQDVVFTSDLDDGAGWSIVADDDTASEFGLDYSRFGIPSAPNGGGTTGLWMAANIVDPGEAAWISATPDDVTVSGRYAVEFDAWVNYNSSGGTTEFIGGFVGFDAAAGSPRSGAGLVGDSDGDSSRDYRLYKNANEQFVESGQFDIPSNNNSDPALMAQFPGQTTPAAQGDAANFNPTNVIVTAPDGTLGYAWHRFTITVDSDAGTANFAIDGFSIGTVDASIGNAVNLSGGIALTFADIFSSVSTKPEFSFGVFDNLVVSQLPPATEVPIAPLPVAVGLLVAGVLALRRRRAAA